MPVQNVGKVHFEYQNTLHNVEGQLNTLHNVEGQYSNFTFFGMHG
jgi:hypothetical protein